MDREVDSLDHVRAILSSNGEQNRHRTINPDAQPQHIFGPSPTSNQNDSTFGAGGRIQQVVDPSFRPPSTQPLSPQILSPSDIPLPPGDKLDEVVIPNYSAHGSLVLSNGFSHPMECSPMPTFSPNANCFPPLLDKEPRLVATSSTNIIDSHSIIIPESQGPFGFVTDSPNSFADLAAKNNFNSTSNSVIASAAYQDPTLRNNNSMSCALQDYGPSQSSVFDNHSSYARNNSSIHNRSVPNNPFEHSDRRKAYNSSSSSAYIRPDLGTLSRPFKEIHLPKPQPRPTTWLNYEPSDIRTKVPEKNHTPPMPYRKDDQPLYSLLCESTATERTESRDRAEANSSNKNSGAPGRIPKKSTSKPSERYDEMTLLNLQSKYRENEARLKSNQNKRQNIEKTLNDMTRNSKGANLELDPMYRQKKDELKQCQVIEPDIKSVLQKISDRAWSRYNHRIVPSSEGPALMRSRRAKMSTATPRDESKESTKHHKSSRLMLDFKDAKTWCRACDLHFDTLHEFSKHLHDEEHMKTLSSSAPWRSSKDKLDRRKTYDTLKSICAKIENETDQKFSLADIDQVLIPGASNKEKTIKSLTLGRERGKFEDDDPIFKIKGYNYLIPVNGFYCSLCNYTLCDFIDLDHHLSGYDHNHAFAKSVALNPQYEIGFRTNLDKSLKRNQPVPEKEDEGSQKASIQPEESSAEKLSNNNTRPVLQYKKPTSHIVDDHDTIAGRFGQNPLRKKQTTSPKKRPELTKQASPPVKQRKTIISLDIVPLGRNTNQSTASLKQLKSIAAPSVTYATAVSSDDEDSSSTSNEQECTVAVNLKAGDPDSPFPGLDLFVTGNQHSDVLKDQRLAQYCHITMSKINLQDYEHMMNDSTTLWSRVNQLMAKKEKNTSKPSIINLDPSATTETAATFFNPKGDDIPIDVTAPIHPVGENPIGSNGPLLSFNGFETDDDDKDPVDLGDIDVTCMRELGSFDLKKVLGDKDPEAKEIANDNTDEELIDDALRNDSEKSSTTNNIDNNKEKMLNMKFLEDFFCEK